MYQLRVYLCRAPIRCMLIPCVRSGLYKNTNNLGATKKIVDIK